MKYCETTSDDDEHLSCHQRNASKSENTTLSLLLLFSCFVVIFILFLFFFLSFIFASIQSSSLSSPSLSLYLSLLLLLRLLLLFLLSSISLSFCYFKTSIYNNKTRMKTTRKKHTWKRSRREDEKRNENYELNRVNKIKRQRTQTNALVFIPGRSKPIRCICIARERERQTPTSNCLEEIKEGERIFHVYRIVL